VKSGGGQALKGSKTIANQELEHSEVDLRYAYRLREAPQREGIPFSRQMRKRYALFCQTTM